MSSKKLELNEMFWCNECQKLTAHVFVRACRYKQLNEIYNDYKCLKCKSIKIITGNSPKPKKFVFR